MKIDYLIIIFYKDTVYKIKLIKYSERDNHEKILQDFINYFFTSVLFISFTVQKSDSLPLNSSFTDFNVVPPAYANIPGTATFLGPFANSQRTYQLLIHANQITALKGSHLQAITFRLPVSATAAGPHLKLLFLLLTSILVTA